MMVMIMRHWRELAGDALAWGIYMLMTAIEIVAPWRIEEARHAQD